VTIEVQTPAHSIKREAARLGFELTGIAPAVTPTGIHHFLDWLDRGYAGEMDYVARREEAYHNPRHVLDGARSIVMLAMNYGSPAEGPSDEATGARVARYAQGSIDYHDILRERLADLARCVKRLFPNGRTRGIVDTAPLLERDFARLAGLGWFGKNTMLINKRQGSLFFLAALLTDLELDYDAPHDSSHCGTCTRCLDACPTDAFVAPYVLDARRCISYLTIELRGPIDLELRDGIGDWLFGCDVCQEVCPWNRKAPATRETAFQPQADLKAPDPIELLSLTEDDFRKRFRHTPLWRTKRSGLLRNAAIVLGNRRDQASVPSLLNVLHDVEPLVRGAAAWALGRFRLAECRDALQARRAIEEDPVVIAELDAALTSSPP